MRMTELLAKVFVKNLVRVATNSRPVAMRTGNVMSETLRESVFR